MELIANCFSTMCKGLRLADDFPTVFDSLFGTRP